MTPNPINYNTYNQQNSKMQTPSYNNIPNNQVNKPFARDIFQNDKNTPIDINYNQVY